MTWRQQPQAGGMVPRILVSGSASNSALTVERHHRALFMLAWGAGEALRGVLDVGASDGLPWCEPRTVARDAVSKNRCVSVGFELCADRAHDE